MHVVIALCSDCKLVAGLHIPSLIVSYFLEVICRYEKSIGLACGSVSAVKLSVQNQIFITFISELSDEGSGDEQALSEGDFDRQVIGF